MIKTFWCWSGQQLVDGMLIWTSPSGRTDVTTPGSALLGVVPAAADEVSALTAAQFAAHAQLYQAVAAQAVAIHEQFVNTLTTSAGSYAASEAANAAAAG